MLGGINYSEGSEAQKQATQRILDGPYMEVFKARLARALNNLI